jgi:LacI family transcriptional regulator
MKKSVSIKRVAVAASVSPMTVSRVINHPASVAPDTRARVLHVIEQLGYRPNAIARSLKLQRTHTIGLITGGLGNGFYVQMSVGAVRELRRHNYRVLLSTTDTDPDGAPDFIHMLNDQRVDGVLLARDTVQADSDPLLHLQEVDLPIVTTGYRLPHPSLHVVDVDNVDGARQAVRHILQCGHRHIAMITGWPIFKAAQSRIEGYRLAHAEAGYTPDARLIREGRWAIASGYECMKDLLAFGPTFSAVFAQSDEIAVGAIHAIREAGLRVPHDISVIGFDDMAMARFFDPPLTTMRQPIEAIGVAAARLLIQKIEHPDQMFEDKLLQTELVIRDSVACI